MSIRKEIWRLGWPVMLVTTMHTLFAIFDLMFISWLGTEQNAGAGIAASIFGVIMVFSSLISSGTTAIAARAVGACDEADYLDVSKQSIAYSIIFGLLTLGIAFATKSLLLSIFGVTEAVYMHAEGYLDIIFLTIPVSFMISTLVAILHAKGDTKTPMWILGIANIFNIIFDWLFIMVLDYGIKGAAAATFIGEVFALIILLYKVMKLMNIGIIQYLRDLKLTSSMMIRIIRIGFFTVVYGVVRPFTGMFMFGLAAKSGNAAIAAFNTGGRLFSLVFIFLGGLEVAISILVGQSLGSKDFEKINLLVKEGIKVAFFCLAILAVPYVIFPKYLIMIFLKDPEVLLVGARYLRIVFIGLNFIVFVTVYNAVLKGAGDTMPSMLGAIFANLAVKIPLAILLSRAGFDSDGIWIAISVSVIAEALIVWIFFKKESWKLKKV